METNNVNEKVSSQSNEQSKCEAVKFLYEKHRELMLKIAYNILGDWYLSEDAVNTTFEKVIKNLNNLDICNVGAIKAYLCVTVRYRAIDIYRANKRYQSVDIDDMSIPDTQNEPLHLLMTKEVFQEVQANILGLPAIYRSTVYYRHGLGFSCNGIAEIMFASRNTVRQRLYRAKKMLKERKNVLCKY